MQKVVESPRLDRSTDATALALIWHAQTHATRNPAGLLCKMLDEGQSPPEKLIAAAQIWLDAGGEIDRAEAERRQGYRELLDLQDEAEAIIEAQDGADDPQLPPIVLPEAPGGTLSGHDASERDPTPDEQAIWAQVQARATRWKAGTFEKITQVDLAARRGPEWHLRAPAGLVAADMKRLNHILAMLLRQENGGMVATVVVHESAEMTR